MTLVFLTLASPAVATSATGLGSKLWATRYDGAVNGFDRAWTLGVSPDGSEVFVAGESYGPTGRYDYATVAYDASTGNALWTKRYDGPAGGNSDAQSLVVSPDGAEVFVTGGSDGSSSGRDYATVAYAAATGDALWKSRYQGPGNGFDQAAAIGVSPDGSRVFVTGRSDGISGPNFATIAYDASTGATLWLKRHAEPGGGEAFRLGVSPDGSEVFATGVGAGPTTFDDFATIAYDASSGKRLWLKHYNGSGNGSDFARALEVSPDGSEVFVTGESDGSTSDRDYATVAYDASTGARVWARRYNGPGNAFDEALAIGVSPDGASVFVTGNSRGTTTLNDYATVAYDGATGARLWVKRYDASANGDGAYALGVGPDGTVFVTGGSISATTSDDYGTVAYDGATGAKLWLRRYDGPANGSDDALATGVSPDGSRLFVTGVSEGASSADYATVAYSSH